MVPATLPWWRALAVKQAHSEGPLLGLGSLTSDDFRFWVLLMQLMLREAGVLVPLVLLQLLGVGFWART